MSCLAHWKSHKITPLVVLVFKMFSHDSLGKKVFLPQTILDIIFEDVCLPFVIPKWQKLES